MTFGISVSKHRSGSLSRIHLTFFLGALIAAGVTYGTAKMQSTWAWRLPSALQGFFSLICIIIIPFIPESPRWLVHQGRHDEALEVLALTYADGDASNPVVVVQFQEIKDTLAFEEAAGETVSMLQMVKTPGSRKRVLLAISVAVFCMVSGTAKPFYQFSSPVLTHFKETTSYLTILGPCLTTLALPIAPHN